MGPRCLVLAGLAIATAAVSHSVAIAAPAGSVKADVSPVRCTDMSDFVAAFPMAGQFDGDPKHVATVTVNIGTPADSAGGTYTIRMDGAQKSTGMVGAGGVTSTTISVPNGKDSRVQVFSGKDIIYDQVVSARC